MHDGSIEDGDAWLKANLNGYYEWAQFHNSLLIVTYDEDDFTDINQIATIFAGPMIKRGAYSQTINHFSLLRTLEDMYGLAHIGAANSATTIPGAFYSQPRAWLPGDANFDGTVNMADPTLWSLGHIPTGTEEILIPSGGPTSGSVTSVKAPSLMFGEEISKTVPSK